ncbi:MAG TPA: hypothetical protein PKA93_06935 [Arachnia sp.]|nr:hypothetical protein [Arachnia sp.]
MSTLLLETLPGWPAAEPASMMHLLLITIIGPFAVGGLFALLYFMRKLTGKETDAAGAEVATRD